MEPFMMSIQDKTLDLNFASSYPHIDKAVEATAAFLAQHACPIKSFDVQLILREGLLNAVHHGNKDNPLRRVYCTLVLDETYLQITVEDEGEGFPAHAYKPEAVDVDIPQGRGLLLMYAYEFDVSFNAKGNVLFLTKEFSDI